MVTGGRGDDDLVHDSAEILEEGKNWILNEDMRFGLYGHCQV